MEDKKAGHRQRVKEKYSELGAGAFFYDYELLELLLFYSIPRVDVKDIAKELLNKFGSIDNILNADIRQLTTVKGIGKESARLIRLVADINKRALDGKDKQTPIDSTTKAAAHFNRLLKNETVEKFAIMLLDNSNRIQFCGILNEGSVNKADVPYRILTKLTSYHDFATGLIIAHNHPRGSACPSNTDVNSTLNIRNFMEQMGITLLDHIIVGENEVYSMRSDLEYNHYFKDDRPKKRNIKK